MKVTGGVIGAPTGKPENAKAAATSVTKQKLEAGGACCKNVTNGFR